MTEHTANHRLKRIRDAARLHRQQLIGTRELYAVIEAHAAVPAPGADEAVVEQVARHLGGWEMQSSHTRVPRAELARELVAIVQASPALATDQTALRDRIAEALMRWAEGNNNPQYAPMRRSETVRANAYSRANAVLAALPPSAEEHRLALSEALGLGTGAPWDAIHDRATELGLPPLGQDPIARRLGLVAEHRATVLAEAADVVAKLREKTDVNVAEYQCYDFRQRIALRDAEGQLRRVAAESAPATGHADSAMLPEGEPTESTDYQVVGDWGVDGADSEAGARAAVAKWLRAYPQCGARAQQRIVRDWPDGSEFYGPWTDLPEQPAAAQQPEEA